MSRPNTYVGVDKDILGGMTPIAKMIRDAHVFGLIEETETCEGWLAQGIDALLEKVNNEWDKYGCIFSSLPPELKARHERIHGAAFKNATDAGWSGATETDDEA